MCIRVANIVVLNNYEIRFKIVFQQKTSMHPSKHMRPSSVKDTLDIVIACIIIVAFSP
jgi:hypothetical protein